jgi:hypothetical protein
MKTINKFLGLGLLSACTLSACTDLDETVYSQIPMENFFKNEKELVSNAGRAYVKLQGYNSEQSLWTLQLQASDECAVPATSTGSWYSGGRYQEVQNNLIPPSNKLIKKGWDWCFNGIAACNEIIYETELSEIEFDGKDKIIAEMQVLRAFFYYEAMSSWGNIPFTIDYTETDYPEQKSRKEIFNFLENELSDDLISKLDAQPSSTNYGRANQATAYCILAKMYLNAEKWFGTPMYDKAAAAAKKVMDLGAYSIEDDYSANFTVNNDNSKENIFVIVYDTAAIPSGSRAFYAYTLALESASCATFNISASPWSGFICEPDFFQSYDANDKRLAQSWLYGPQYDISGSPIMITDSNGNDVQMSYNPVFDEKQYYNANGGRQKYDGARLCKWAYQTDGLLTSGETCMDNDFALFRYADVVLMYAEALVRQGRQSEAANLPDLQKIRTRAGLEPYTASQLTLDELYAERGRELAWEGWRHEDMIRFGKYLKQYWAHPAQEGDTFRELFPIPTEILNANPRLQQNTGYN